MARQKRELSTGPTRYRESPLANARKPMPLCRAIRRDGAPCQRFAGYQSEVCHNHGAKEINPRRYGPAYAKRAQEIHKAENRQRAIDKQELARIPPEVEVMPEFQLLIKDRAVPRALEISRAWAKVQLGGSMEEFREVVDAALARHAQAQARHKEAYERRYREREALGIPHPEDRSRW
jgi:hypothetical protein